MTERIVDTAGAPATRHRRTTSTTSARDRAIDADAHPGRRRLARAPRGDRLALHAGRVRRRDRCSSRSLAGDRFLTTHQPDPHGAERGRAHRDGVRGHVRADHRRRRPVGRLGGDPRRGRRRQDDHRRRGERRVSTPRSASSPGSPSACSSASSTVSASPTSRCRRSSSRSARSLMGLVRRADHHRRSQRAEPHAQRRSATAASAASRTSCSSALGVVIVTGVTPPSHRLRPLHLRRRLERRVGATRRHQRRRATCSRCTPSPGRCRGSAACCRWPASTPRRSAATSPIRSRRSPPSALGGTSVFGGVGTIVGTMIGVWIPGVLRNGIIILGVQPYWQGIIIGLVLVGHRVVRPVQAPGRRRRRSRRHVGVR